ncbi:MAG: hypothetical protein EXR62_15835 [Chloroflexi bacterium]|nr:hypothetical protein [Chloroflexota bacterium]
MWTPLDYGRSFLIGKAPSNEVMFWVESRTRIIDEKNGTSEDYVQCASCKSEHTFAAHDLLQDDNYDFMPIFGPEYGLIFRRKAWLNPNYKSVVLAENMWAGQIYNLVEARALRELHTVQDVIDATHTLHPLVAQTEIWQADTGLRAIIEYPVKTMNTNREKHIYQVDTGPVLLPDLSQRWERHADGMSLAFVVFNVPDFADFVIEGPTVIADAHTTAGEPVKINHYSRKVSLTAQNRLYVLE